MKMMQTMSMLAVAAMALGSCNSQEIPTPEEKIALIVSSHSSGISGVESDVKRLVPDGKFTKSLWINASNHSNRNALIKNWLTEIAL